MLPVTHRVTADQIENKIPEPTGFYNRLPDVGDVPGLNLPCYLGDDKTIPNMPI